MRIRPTCMTGPTPSLRSPAAQTISGISGSLIRGDMLKDAWPDGVFYGPSILRCMDMPINGPNPLYVDCNDLFIEYKSCFHQVLGEMPVP